MSFTLRGSLPKRTRIIVEVTGAVIMLLLWFAVTDWFKLFPPSILPSPLSVLLSLKELHYDNALIRNALYSLKLNIYGLLEAVVVALPLGMIIGLVPVLRCFSERYITMIRFLPLTALTGLFIAWFGIETNMKVQFLAVSIFLYLLPAVIEKVDNVENVYVQTVRTLGASNWQTIRTIFIPAVVSRSFDSIRVLAALSWTYIVVAEVLNINGGGIGALSFLCARQSRIDKFFGVLIIILFIGYMQDKILILLDRLFFPFKYVKKGK
jgi:NitT/TauT family transport system permease protein